MEFEPTCSFSIRKFTYDETHGELCVHYYDGRQKACNGVPAPVVAALRDSTDPESLLQPFLVSDRADE